MGLCVEDAAHAHIQALCQSCSAIDSPVPTIATPTAHELVIHWLPALPTREYCRHTHILQLLQAALCLRPYQRVQSIATQPRHCLLALRTTAVPWWRIQAPRHHQQRHTAPSPCSGHAQQCHPQNRTGYRRRPVQSIRACTEQVSRGLRRA